MSKESTSYDSVAWGRQLGDDREQGWLGDIDSHARAYPERVAQARRYFREIPFDSLKVVQTGPDRYSLFDADGTEYRPEQGDPFQGPDPAHLGIVGFTIDGGNYLHFLRRRGESAVPTDEVVLVWSVREEKVA